MEAKERFFELNPAGLAVLSYEGRLLEVNPVLAELLAAPPTGRLISCQLAALVADEDRPAIRSLINAAAAGQATGSIRVRLLCPADREQTALVSLRDLPGEGLICAVLPAPPTPVLESLYRRVEQRTLELTAANQRLILEVQRRRSAEEQLAESQARIEAILDALPDQIVFLDAGRRIAWANRAALIASGLPGDQVVGRLCHVALHRTLIPCQNCLTGQALQTGRLVNRQAQEVDGRHWLVRAAPVRDRSGTVVGAIEVREETTDRVREAEERRQLEERVIRAERLESLGSMAAAIAHDFNNLLMSVLGNCSLALEEIPPRIPIRESLLEIQRAGLRAAEISVKMLACTGRGHLELAPIDLDDEVARAIGALEIPPRVRLELAPAGNLPVVMADAAQLRQAIQALVSNAVEAFGSNPGLIRFRTDLLARSQGSLFDTGTGEHLPQGRYLQLEVIDSGPGMSAEVLNHIFDPFFTTKFLGRGLGLAAALGIVRAHRGTIEVDSQPGRGSVFRIFLPVETPHRTARAQPLEPYSEPRTSHRA